MEPDHNREAAEAEEVAEPEEAAAEWAASEGDPAGIAYARNAGTSYRTR